VADDLARRRGLSGPLLAVTGSAAAAAELFDAAAPSTLDVGGVSAPIPLHHTLILASHAWGHEPLHTLRDLIDVALVATQVDPAELERTAAARGIPRLWRTTRHAIDALFYGGPRSAAPFVANHLE